MAASVEDLVKLQGTENLKKKSQEAKKVIINIVRSLAEEQKIELRKTTL